MLEDITPEKAREILENSPGEYRKGIIKKVLEEVDRDSEEILVTLNNVFPDLGPLEEFKAYSQVFEPFTTGYSISQLVKIASNDNYEFNGISRPLEGLRFVRKDCLDKYKDD